MRALAYPVLAAAAFLLLGGCSILPFYSHVNEPRPTAPQGRGIGESDEVPSGAFVASEAVPWKIDTACRDRLVVAVGPQQATRNPREACAQDDRNFVALALSGGGSRAAVFSAQVMFELERYGLLQDVDVISSVSGGSYTAALYALSCDPLPAPCPATVEGPPRTRWREDEVFPRLQHNFIRSWILNWFWPENFVRYWLTYYDRTDIMAETLADNLYDNSLLGNEGYRMQDLNPQRPNLLINATNNTFVDVDANIRRHQAGQLDFTFSEEDFAALDSDLDNFPVAYAVVASSAFPGAFQYVTLQDFATPHKSYVHLFDAGTSDNLGLTAVERVVQHEALPDDADRLVILVDAYIPTVGKPASVAEPRAGVDYFVDTNFLDAYDTLMSNLRLKEVENLRDQLPHPDADFLWFTFDDLRDSQPGLYRVVSRIKTDLAIDDNDAACLRLAARLLVEARMADVRRNHPALRLSEAALRPASPLPRCDTTPKPEPEGGFGADARGATRPAVAGR